MSLKVKGQLKEAQVENLAADPANLPHGRIWLDTVVGKIKASIAGVAKSLVTEDGTQTLSGKTFTYPIVNDTFSMVDQGVDPATPASGYKNLYAKATGLFFRNSSGTIRQFANLDEAQALTNKDIDGGTASNTSRITLPKAAKTTLDALTRKQGTVLYDTTSNRPYYDDGTNLQLIGSGSGGVNFITNPDAEAGTNGWTVDSFAAASRPSGALTGVSTGITFTTSPTAPLAGSNSFTFAKDAVNRQGRVVYTGLTFTPAYFARVMNITVDMILESGTFASGTPTTDSDLIWYIQNVTDGTFIEPSSFKILSNSTTNSFQFNGTFQTGASATSYRLLLYVASTSASAYTMKFDNVVVTPSTYAYGTPITDWQSYTPTFTGAGTATNVAFWYRRIGDSIEIKGNFTTGTVTAANASFTLPSGLSIDTTKAATLLNDIFGDAVRQNSSASTRKRFKLATNSGTGNVVFWVNDDYTAAAGPNSAITGTSAWASTENQAVFLTGLPIQGWSSSVQMSDQTSTRVVAAAYSIASAATTTTSARVRFDTKILDTHGAVTTGASWVFTAPVSGFYKIGINMDVNAACNYQLYVNGSTAGYMLSAPSSLYGYGERFVELNAGNTLYVVADTGGIVQATSYLSIYRLAGPNQIAASETVCANYGGTTSTVTNAGDTIIIMTTKAHDTHNAYNTTTGEFNCPISGKYEVYGQYVSTIASGAVSAGISAIVKRNSTTVANRTIPAYTTSSVPHTVNVSTIVDCVAGDKLALYSNQQMVGGAQAITNSTVLTYVTFKRVGN